MVATNEELTMIKPDIQTLAKNQEKRAATIKSMEGVLALPSGTPERWRAGFTHFLRQRPEAKPEADFIAAEVRERRKQMDKFASTKNGRMAYSTPSWLLLMLRSIDPDYFLAKTGKDLSGARHLKLMQRAFPEYFYPEVI